MVSGMWKILRTAAFALTLAACGGGGGGGAPTTTPPALSETEVERVRSDERVVRLRGILARADALLLTSARARYSLEVADGVRVSAATDVRAYGFWGEHGYAALELGAGPLTGDADGTAFTGEFAFARAYAAGDASGSNPGGAGSATWRGIVEASPAGAFERLQGTVTLTIADLARPRVGVSVDVAGHDIDRPAWADVPLATGRFSTGTAGTDYLAGHFHGPGGEEAWGVFDTSGYLGAFGAKRAP